MTRRKVVAVLYGVGFAAASAALALVILDCTFTPIAKVGTNAGCATLSVDGIYSCAATNGLPLLAVLLVLTVALGSVSGFSRLSICWPLIVVVVFGILKIAAQDAAHYDHAVYCQIKSVTGPLPTALRAALVELGRWFLLSPLIVIFLSTRLACRVWCE